MIDELLYQVLGASEEQGLRGLIYEARRSLNLALVYLILSVAQEQGAAMGPASRDELARARERSAHYEWLLREVSACAEISVMKGPAMARLYPPRVLRAYGDIDLFVRDEATLWQAVEWIAGHQPVQDLDITIIGDDPRHVVVAMSWAATDPLIDPKYRVEISTAALMGDLAAAPVRTGLPADPVVAALLAIAEEGFQRPFAARDALDVAILDQIPMPPVPDVLAIAGAYARAPELLRLLRYASDSVSLGSLGDLLAALGPVAGQEEERRARLQPAAATEDVPECLAAGRAVYGLPVSPFRWRGGRSSRVTRFAGGHLLSTPVGDYLLTGGSVIGTAEYEAAVAFAAAAARP